MLEVDDGKRNEERERVKVAMRVKPGEEGREEEKLKLKTVRYVTLPPFFSFPLLSPALLLKTRTLTFPPLP